MMFWYELYFTKKRQEKEDWIHFFSTLAKYNGLFCKGRLFILLKENTFRFYVKTKRALPPMIDSLSSVLLKQADVPFDEDSFATFSFPMIHFGTLIDFFNYFEIKKKKKLVLIEITFQKLYEGNIHFSCFLSVQAKEQRKKYHLFFFDAARFLSTSLEENKRYFYKTPPTYFALQKVLPLLSPNPTSSLFEIDPFPYDQTKRYLHPEDYSFFKHSVLFGSSGSGKSKFISLFITRILENPSLSSHYKFIIIDPHASLKKEIGTFSKVIDFMDLENSIDLFQNKDSDVIADTELFLELFQTLLQDQYNPKLERVLRYSIYLLLTAKQFHFQTLKKLVLDLSYRTSILKEYKEHLPLSILDFFLSDFNELKTQSYSQAIAPILSFLDEVDLLPFFHQRIEEDGLKEMIEKNGVTLFSFERRKLGDKITKTLAGLIMQQIFSLMSQEGRKEHFIFIIDEVARVENPILPRFLSEARKYQVSLLLAGQYFNQISESLKNAILANVSNYYLFRLSKGDASFFVDNLSMKIPLDDRKEKKVEVLANLKDRECLLRLSKDGVLLPAFLGRTVDFKARGEHERKKEMIEEKKREEKVKSFSFVCEEGITMKEFLQENALERRRKYESRTSSRNHPKDISSHF